MNTIGRIRTEANEYTAICRAGRQDLTAMPDFVRRRDLGRRRRRGT